MRVGDIVLKRSIYRGECALDVPAPGRRRVGRRLGIYCGPGNRGKAMRRGPDGYLKRWVTDAPPFDTRWEGGSVLRFERAGRGAQHRDLLGRGLGVPRLVRQPAGADGVNGRFLDTTDLALDVTVAPDGSWEWKDEDELAEAISLGRSRRGGRRRACAPRASA